ncbi:universal stress protein UspA-like protein [Halovivax ruber XH-70]|uniref:Universal stress protein UspA-like protein n=1 Tax=Halovivax ruber (strain DSM 18193 / JCM 13892 / XH-70) TaxID=797302 RepID=L0IFC2_HALRX|nr:universal stress protein [Halovivax ruber]AGB17538.1 universal stress protein UspA-like protein [Halovivax ruber XH-70]
MTKSVLVPVDGSEQSERALDYALEAFPDASITLLYVFEGGPPEIHLEQRGQDYDALRERRHGMLERLVADRPFEGDVDTAVRIGRPSREIVACADDRAVDHILVGSHGRDGASRVLLGSVAETVVRRAPVPVTVVR